MSDQEIDFAAIKDGLTLAVPMVNTLQLEFLELSREHSVLRLPDDQRFHNHIGGPHAGALFTLGESATGAVVIGSFADLLGELTPLAYGGQIRYRAPAFGDVTATARLATASANVRAAVVADGKARFEAEVELHDPQQALVAELSITWALHRNDPSSGQQAPEDGR